MNSMPKRKKFLWGASSAAHQVEGNNYNDWTVWEQENAFRLAKEPKKYYLKYSKMFLSIEPPWELMNPHFENPKNYISGDAVDHYNRYSEDFKLAQDLGHNAHRFSIEWSRIEPKQGEFDSREIEHYRNVLKELKSRGLEPVATLWHFTLPVWAYEMGGFSNKKVANYFLRFVDLVSKEYADLVTYWIVLNEPVIYTFATYFIGVFPNGNKGFFSGLKAIKNFIYVTNRAGSYIKKYNNKALVGVSKQDLDARFTTSWNHFLAYSVDFFWNLLFIVLTKKNLDFIGLNYYISKIFGKKKAGLKYSDMGWGLYPKGLYNLLKKLQRFGKPILITECGLADSKDIKRGWYIKEVIENIKKAKAEGVVVTGFIYWSLTDNFEWDKGFWPKFGLVEIDYNNRLSRKTRRSGYIYKKLIEENFNI